MLPVIDTRIVEQTQLPCCKESVLIKPYNSAQEKNILMSLADPDKQQWLVNIREIMKQNVVEGDLKKIQKSIDFVYLAMKLRMMSKGDKLKYTFKCPNIIDDKPCNNLLHADDSFDDLMIIKNPDNHKIIHKINSSLSVELVPPNVGYLDYLCQLSGVDENEIENMNQSAEYRLIQKNLELICNDVAYSINKVFIHNDKDEKMYDSFTAEELMENVIQYLTVEEVGELVKAKQELISLVVSLKKECPKCKYIYEREISNFFAFIT